MPNPEIELAVSNIAWEPSEDDEVAEVLREADVDRIIIAPTKIRDNPLDIDSVEAQEYAEYWQARGTRILGMQSLLFGRPDLKVFEDAETRAATADYLAHLINTGAWMGVEVYGFGSAENRLVGDRPETEVDEIAAEFFGDLGSLASFYDSTFCLESTAGHYGADYGRTAA